MMEKGKAMKKVFMTVALIMAVAGSAYAQRTDFIELVRTGTPQQIQAAIKQGADINAAGYHHVTALMFAAARNQNPEVVTVLLKAGAEVDARDAYGRTSLMAAAAGSEWKDKQEHEVQSKNGEPPESQWEVDDENEEPIRLSGHGADSSEKLRSIGIGDLPMTTSTNKVPEAIEEITLLLKAGADVNAQDWRGNTALDYARHNPALRAILLKAGGKEGVPIPVPGGVRG